MVRDDTLWSLGRQPLSPTQLPLSSVFLLHAGSTAAKGGEPHETQLVATSAGEPLEAGDI